MLLLLCVLQATHSQFRRPEDLKCPKCGQAGVLQGNGFRQGTRCVLHPDGQEKVFSHGMTHKECPAHGGKGGAYHLLHCYSFTATVLTVVVIINLTIVVHCRLGGGGGQGKTCPLTLHALLLVLQT